MNEITYLESEIRVWSDRRNRATVSGNKDLIALYINPEMDAEMGKMLARLHMLREEFNGPITGQARGCGGKRRAKAVPN